MQAWLEFPVHAVDDINASPKFLPPTREGRTLETSLCFILPVHNAEHWIADQLLDLLDILPDLTSRFQILVVDDASTDQTEDLVQDLSQEFPQIHVVRQREQGGMQAAARFGLANTTADIVLVHENETRISHTQLRRLWAVRGHDQSVTLPEIPEPKPIPPDVMDRLVKWGEDLTKMDASAAEIGGLQMFRPADDEPTSKETKRFSRTDSPQDGQPELQPPKLRQMRRALTRIRRPAE